MIKKQVSHFYIIGAGFAGQMIAGDIKRKKIFGSVSAFLDDDKALIGKDIDGIPVLGPIEDVIHLLKSADSDEAIIAIPSAKVEKIKAIYESLKKNGFKHIKILPSISQVVNGTAHLVQAREIDPLDILGRTPVTISLKESLSYLRGKRVLITGAGGSIGSELARQLLSGGAERLYLFGHGENSIYQINRELKVLQAEGVGEKATIVPIIGDMKDREYVRYIISHTKCDVIFHCAAYKHVPLMEENPVAVIENNVFGTKNLLDASIEFGVKKFVLISTDKAVSPVSIYGASKFLCEKLLLDASSKVKNQDFMFVRFGNVLGSRGSILPLFMEQIKNGGPVTVTDPRMERFFMTIPEACSLVLQTGGVGKNGFSYLLDMGEPIKIKDLAEHIIEFSGLEPGKDIEILYTGVRKGERLTEPLWLKEENPQATEYSKILKLSSLPLNFNLEQLIEELKEICLSECCTDKTKYRNVLLLRETLQKVIPELKQNQSEVSEVF
ncbi:nucleoside-diphosphate sugar epimerase/dehydratase [Treponema sp.]|uniref:polysaccharide biosynthesis protein n=1 Tax=Treponema sp. TaxID=166 RepID=UPI00298E1FF0|nr:nucleoside-diphosphate sugar epimerase/dehydratase [Treponema sp.]MCR5612090.1 polysaccharide biosynthesis protein [Treponema sp.]